MNGRGLARANIGFVRDPMNGFRFARLFWGGKREKAADFCAFSFSECGIWFFERAFIFSVCGLCWIFGQSGKTEKKESWKIAEFAGLRRTSPKKQKVKKDTCFWSKIFFRYRKRKKALMYACSRWTQAFARCPPLYAVSPGLVISAKRFLFFRLSYTQCAWNAVVMVVSGGVG